MYSAAAPFSGSTQPPRYNSPATAQPYDPPVSPVSNDLYNHFAEMDEHEQQFPAELRADRTGNA